MKKAIIITENSYPEGDAGAVRQHAFAKMLSDMDYEVLVIGYGKSTEEKICVYDNINYISYRVNSLNKIYRVWNRIRFGDKVFDYISQNYKQLDLLLVVDLMPSAFKKIVQLKKKYNCTLIHDSVEWYSKEEFRYGKLDLAYRRKEFTNTKVIDEMWNVVAISTFLEKHFQKFANRVVRIPVIMDIKNIEYRTKVEPSGKIVFSYAGGPGKKDFLREIISGFALLNQTELHKVELNIIGVNKDQLINMCEVDKKAIAKLGDCLKIHGRVERSVAINYIRQSDYSLLIRDENLRYAKAGFPTKIVESLACGTPPLCNYSSDLELYLKDRQNSIIANGHTSKDVCEAVKNALCIVKEKDRAFMRKNARELALNCFDYSVYKDLLFTVCDE